MSVDECFNLDEFVFLGLKQVRPLIPIEHGTQKGYQAERRRGLDNCIACLLANREFMKEYMRQYRGKS